VLPIGIEYETVRFDVTVWITETTEGLEITWTFRSELFEEATILRLNRHYETLLRSVVADPEARIDSFEIWSAEEKQRRVQEDRAWREVQANKLGARRRKAMGGSPDPTERSEQVAGLSAAGE
jgi:non-ribosomal peptide synthetase component F